MFKDLVKRNFKEKGLIWLTTSGEIQPIFAVKTWQQVGSYGGRYRSQRKKKPANINSRHAFHNGLLPAKVYSQNVP